MAASKLLVLLTTLAAAATTVSAAPLVAAEAQVSAASGSGASQPLCDQEQLVALGAILKNTSRKAQCQEKLKITEMLTPPGGNFDVLCDKGASCTIALSILYNTLPQCRYKDWSPQESADKILRYCGVTPLNTTAIAAIGSGSVDGDIAKTPAPTPVVTWGSQQGVSQSFAPVGATPAPAGAASASPAPTTSAATASPASRALVLAASLLATAAVYA